MLEGKQLWDHLHPMARLQDRQITTLVETRGFNDETWELNYHLLEDRVKVLENSAQADTVLVV